MSASVDGEREFQIAEDDYPSASYGRLVKKLCIIEATDAYRQEIMASPSTRLAIAASIAMATLGERDEDYDRTAPTRIISQEN